MNNYWDSADYITLPVRLVDGHWELLYGGKTGIRDGAYGELRVLLASIEDTQLRNRLARTVTVKVLNQGTELLVALRDRNASYNPDKTTYIDPRELPAGCTRLEKIWIGPPSRSTSRIEPKEGGLWIRQRGVDKTDLVCSSVVLPNDLPLRRELPFGNATSLNHACTLLSEAYETHRISHTMNVYEHVFYQEPASPDARWWSIERLRSGVIADMELHIMTDAWRQLEEQLGFRPIGPESRGAQRRRR